MIPLLKVYLENSTNSSHVGTASVRLLLIDRPSSCFKVRTHERLPFLQGMRTFVVTNYTDSAQNPYPREPGESWAFYPDAKPVRSFYPGDQRAALTPFLAYRRLGDTFKWLLYGDDDTVFFTEAALGLASTMDSELPYVITDNIWWSPLFGDAYHPHLQVSSNPQHSPSKLDSSLIRNPSLCQMGLFSIPLEIHTMQDPLQELL